MGDMVLQMLQKQQSQKPLFTAEGPQFYQQAYQHNAPFATKGPYQTQLPPEQESQFRSWVKQNQVPFDPNAQLQDYDMRGYWQSMQQGQQAPWQGGKSHFPDTYKTPYDTTFSGESKYAKPGTPFTWHGNQLIDKRTGRLIYGTGND